jgi:hypothetical protein
MFLMLWCNHHSRAGPISAMMVLCPGGHTVETIAAGAAAADAQEALKREACVVQDPGAAVHHGGGVRWFQER